MVIAFFGADSKVGTTMLAQSFAEMLTDKGTVLFLSLSRSFKSAFVRDDIKHIDCFVPEIESGIAIEKNKISKHSHYSNLYILGGLKDVLEPNDFSLEMASKMIENLERMFDWIIIDAGSDMNNALSYAAVTGAFNRFLVFSQNQHCIDKVIDNSKKWELLNLEFNMLIANKFKAFDVNGWDRIKKIFPFPADKIIKIRYVDREREAEAEGKTFFDYGERKFIRDLQLLRECLKENENGKI